MIIKVCSGKKAVLLNILLLLPAAVSTPIFNGIGIRGLAMWATIATHEQAKRIVGEHYKNEKTFNAPFGVRTLSKMEKMYNVRASGNQSLWTGPIWGVSNYMVFKGLVNYGFDKEAKKLAQKTVLLFGKDFERFGALHEYFFSRKRRTGF